MGNAGYSITGFKNKEFESALSGLGQVIQDSDDNQAKEQIKVLLRDLSDVVRILVVGSQGSGRTTFWKNLLLEHCPQESHPTSGVEEVRCGEMEALFTVEPGYTRRFVQDTGLDGVAVFDTGEKDVLRSARLRALAAACDVVFVVFSADNIQSPPVWDFLESGLEWKKAVFVLTMADRYSGDEIGQKTDKLKLFMREAGISAPVFPVAAGNAKGMDPVRLFVADTVLSANPKLKKQQDNVCLVRRFVEELKGSFEQRCGQYEADSRIMEYMDRQMDAFRRGHDLQVKRLEDEIRREISDRINEYEQEIVARLDPRTIKERFTKKQDFADYLELVNENYQNLLNRAVEHKAQSAVRDYLHDLEMVYEDVGARLEARPELLELEDRFYGSLAKSKREITVRTRDMVVQTSGYYHTLYDASEKLFLKIWREREILDRRIEAGTAAGVIVGGVAGAYAGAAVAGILGAGTLGAGVLGFAVMLAGAVRVGIMAKKLAAAVASPHMEKEVNRCIREFRDEVRQIRDNMTEQVLAEVRRLFDSELDRVDKSFLEFRVVTNIDSRRLPDLRGKLEQVEGLLELAVQG